MMVAEQERELMARLIAGEEAAQRRVVARFYPMLLRVGSARRGLCDADAEEVAFEVLAEFLMAPARFDPARGVPLGGYLARLAHNRAVDRVRRQAREEDVVVAAGASCTRPPADRPSPGIEAAGRLLSALFGELPTAQRRALEWHANGMPHALIAGWLGRNEPAVRQQVSRGKRRLRARFEAELGRLPEEVQVRIRAAVGGAQR